MKKTECNAIYFDNYYHNRRINNLLKEFVYSWFTPILFTHQPTADIYAYYSKQLPIWSTIWQICNCISIIQLFECLQLMLNFHEHISIKITQIAQNVVHVKTNIEYVKIREENKIGLVNFELRNISIVFQPSSDLKQSRRKY